MINWNDNLSYMPKPKNPVHERTHAVSGHDYLQKYRYVRNAKTGRYDFQLLESRPLHPIYRRSGPPGLPPYETYPCTLLQFGLLATHVMNHTLTAEVARHLIEGMGVEVPPGTLHALGIRVDLGEKTLSPEFLLWRSPPSDSPVHALRATRRPRSSTGARPRRSSPSTGGSP